MHVSKQSSNSAPSSLPEISSGTARFSVAQSGLQALGTSASKLISQGMGHIQAIGYDPEIASISQSFASEVRGLQSVADQAQAIMRRAADRAEGGAPSLSKDEAQQLEDLNDAAGKRMESITELVKQLYFKRKDDDDKPGAAGAAPMLTVEVSA